MRFLYLPIVLLYDPASSDLLLTVARPSSSVGGSVFSARTFNITGLFQLTFYEVMTS